MPSSSCQQCGANLKLAPSGRRKRFCSGACRQAAFRNEMTANKAPSYPTKGYQNCASELIETQNDFLSRNEELALPRSFPRSVVFGGRYPATYSRFRGAS